MTEQRYVAQHLLVFPFPAQGHMRAMLKLAELLSTANFYVSFLNTEHIHRRLANLLVDFHRPKFRFLTIPDGLPEDDPRSLIRWMDVHESMNKRSKGHFRDILVQDEERDGWPRISCIIADEVNSLALDVAEPLRIPVMIVQTSSICCTTVYSYVPELIERGSIPIEGDDMDELIQDIPGMETFLRRRDLPSFIRDAKSIDDPMIHFRIIEKLAGAKSFIFNTSETIDELGLSRLRSMCSDIYPIGPINILLEHMDRRNQDEIILSSKSASLWKEDRSCITWLNSQPNKSVVYVSFGSITIISKEMLLEFYHGFVNSGRKFLWVIRLDMVENETKLSDLVPLDLIEASGHIVSWAPQEEVLAHPATGCFVTHAGWNSTLESIVAGVPMICWPFFGDQQTTSRFVSEVWKIGVDMTDMKSRGVVEKMVREVMDGKKSEELRKNAREIADRVRKGCEYGGSSYKNFEKLVDHIKSLNIMDV